VDNFSLLKENIIACTYVVAIWSDRERDQLTVFGYMNVSVIIHIGSVRLIKEASFLNQI